MKTPWFTFAGICSLVFGIVIFCVVFGGYSSLLRSQNRVQAVKEHLVAQCREQLGVVSDFSELAAPESAGSRSEELRDAAASTALVLNRIQQADAVFDPELIAAFEASQINLNQSVDGFVQEILKDGIRRPESYDALEKRLEELELAVFIMGKRYNKEARYFNTRTKVFPGFLIAPLFGLDDIHYPEIAVHLLAPSREKASSSAS